MDKEILRIIIIATGLVVVIGMIFWSYWKGKKSERERDFLEGLTQFGQDSSSVSEAAIEVNHPDDFDIIPRGQLKPSTGEVSNYFNEDIEDEADGQDYVPRLATPSIIQFSLVANSDEGFNGAELVNAFADAGLIYGSMKIFERIDANQMVDFSVACMVEPGTFPDTNLESFYCPGIVFFMQPGELENAQAVFDDFVETITILATELNGSVRDHERLPLTDATVQALRRSL